MKSKKTKQVRPRTSALIVGVLASHDSITKNNALTRNIEKLYRQNKPLLERFHFLFTGGTFGRVVKGTAESKRTGMEPLDSEVRQFILNRSTCLPGRHEGGVTVLANYVVTRQCKIVWPFLDPIEPHWLNQENLALMRLCDVWKAKRLMNSGSVLEWFNSEADRDAEWNQESSPPPVVFADSDELLPRWTDADRSRYLSADLSLASKRPRTIALIAHDDMKGRMIDFVVEYEKELSQFKRILATSTTGHEIERITGGKLNVICCRSGPKGGDIQIATEILAGRCDYVVFFVDPLHPHPHLEDIRVVFGACMIENNVRMLTNEVQAREWMEQVVRARTPKTVRLSK